MLILRLSGMGTGKAASWQLLFTIMVLFFDLGYAGIKEPESVKGVLRQGGDHHALNLKIIGKHNGAINGIA